MSSEDNSFLLASGRGSISEPGRLYMQSSRIWLTGGERDVGHKNTVTTKLIAKIWKHSNTATTNSDGMLEWWSNYENTNHRLLLFTVTVHPPTWLPEYVLNYLKQLNFCKNPANIWIFWQFSRFPDAAGPHPVLQQNQQKLQADSIWSVRCFWIWFVSLCFSSPTRC